MPVMPSKKLAISKRRREVAELYVQAWTQMAIADRLGIAQSTVSDDLKAIRKEWRESRVRDFDEAVAVELEKIDRLESEAWEAWKRSQEPLENTRVMDDGSRKKAQKVVEQRDGDPRFLEQIHKCIASRRALLGLDAPTRIAPTSPDGDESYHSHVMLELMRLAEKSKHGPEVIDAEYVEQQLAQPKIGHDKVSANQEAEDERESNDTEQQRRE
nr:hypothetical protein 7 [Pseudomonadaceae bacterium]